MRFVRDRRTRRGRWGWALALVLVAFAPACAPIRDDVVPTASQAIARPTDTLLGRGFAGFERRQDGKSGFRLINNGVSALMTRAALADLAEKTIDFQTFIFDADEVGAFVLDRLIAAARRGVRVRILLDDYQLGLDDWTLARLNATPNIEVRLYNPFPDRLRWSRPFQLVFNLDRLGRRMHNKLFATDNQLALIGGRNISNHYFEAVGEQNFRDIELVVAGPVVEEASQSFDAFWKSAIVVPAAALNRDGQHHEAREHLADLLKKNDDAEGPMAEYRRQGEAFRARVQDPASYMWAKGRVVAEPPIRQPPGAAKPSAEIARAHAIARQAAGREIVYEVAYFVPGTRGVEVLGDLVKRGVAVTVLTNSLASTDVVAVHSSYAFYRQPLLEAGVKLFEYRVDAKRPEPAGHRLRLGRSESGLHAKIVVYDRKIVWVGSANFDPRSRRLNTEIGLMIESEELAGRILEGIALDFSPSHSWRLDLRDEPDSGLKRLVWIGHEDGRILERDHEPDAGLWRRLNALFYAVLPGIEELL
jgi:putative cardiolipin synthase